MGWPVAAKIIILDLRPLPHLTIKGHKMKTPHASSGIVSVYDKSPPCLMDFTK